MGTYYCNLKKKLPTEKGYKWEFIIGLKRLNKENIEKLYKLGFFKEHINFIMETDLHRKWLKNIRIKY